MKEKFFIFGLTFLFMAIHSRAEFFFNAPNNDGVTIYYQTIDGEGDRAMVSNHPQLYSGVVNIPDSAIYEGVKYSVEAIGPYVFYDNVELTEVSLGPNITVIMEKAFYNCTALESIKFGNKVETIEKDAFYGCKSLKSITLPEGLTEIRDGVFCDCSSLVDITIPASVTKIGNASFGSCGFTSFTVTDGVTSIGKEAFGLCKDLTSFSIGENLSSIGKDIFFGSISLKEITVSEKNKTYASIDGVLVNHDKNELILYPLAKSANYTIPNSITTIGSYAFYNCTILTGIDGGVNVDSIGPGAFYLCTGLKTFTFPDKLSYIADSVFLICLILDNITIPDGVKYIGNNAFERCLLNKLTIGNGVSTIGEWTFSDCPGLTKITIPDNVVSIGKLCFYGCNNVAELTIGKNLSKIGPYAFGAMSGLKVINNRNAVPQIGENLFDHAMWNPTPKLFVPIGSGAAYREADNWNQFLIEETENVSNEAINKENIFIKNTIGGIIISSNIPEKVCVYTVSGQLVYQTLLANAQIVSLPRGIYIVKTNKVTKKIAVQ